MCSLSLAFLLNRRILAQRLGDDEDAPGEEQLAKDFRDAQRECAELTARLQSDYEQAEADVTAAFNIPILNNSKFTFSRNVDEDFQTAYGGDERLRRTLLAELKQIDHKFESKIKDIDKAHKLE